MRLIQTLATGAALAAPLALVAPIFAQADSKPAPAPAAPAAAPGQVDEKAKSVLGESGAAIKKITGLTFKVKRELTGNPQLKMGSVGEARFVRNAVTGSASSFYAKGTQTRPITNDEVPIEGFYNGTIASWLDETKKELVEQMVAAPDAAKKLKTIRDQLMPATFFEAEPFLAEMGGMVIKLDAPAEVGGVKCDVVRVMNPTSQRETRISIAQSDKLPRRIEQISPGVKGVSQSYSLEITDLKVAPDLKATDFKIALPAGYQKRLEAGQPAKPIDTGDKAPVTPPPPPPGPPMGGLEAGASAPPWALKRADTGGNVTLAEQKGKVVVMGFWGPLFADSKSTLAVLEQTSGQFKDKASFFGVSCRQGAGAPGEAAAKAAFGEAKVSYPLLLDGDPVVADYKVRGFPSVAVITADGKVAAFFESTPTADELKAAVETAVSGK